MAEASEPARVLLPQQLRERAQCTPGRIAYTFLRENGSEQVARLAGRTLAREGVFVNAVEYPGVPLGAARLRLQVMAAHHAAQLRQGARMIGTAVSGAGAALGVEPARQPWPRERARG